MQIRSKLFSLLPPQWRYSILSLWAMTKATNISYSQNGEDIILAALFRKRVKGFYVDIGAHHPKRYSNTHKLYKRGWRGINIDANPTSIIFFRYFRRRDTNLCLGVGLNNGTLEYHQFSEPAVNTFSTNDAEKQKQKKWNTYLGSKKIPVKTINNILGDYLPPNTAIDFLNIDIEGLDFEVLKSLDWTKYRPNIVVIEDHQFDADQPINSEIYNFLTNEGYHLHSVLGFSLVFTLISNN